jgi:universal stress protein E
MPWYAYRNILLALDCSEFSSAAVRAAEEFVLSAGTRASVVHAYQSQYDGMTTSRRIAGNVIDAYSADGKQEASAHLCDLLRESSDDSSRYELILERATTTAAIRNVVARLNPDLLVLGTRGRGRGRWRRALLGSVANRLLSSAKSDVLAVPQRDIAGVWEKARSERVALDVVSGV